MHKQSGRETNETTNTNELVAKYSDKKINRHAEIQTEEQTDRQSFS